MIHRWMLALQALALTIGSLLTTRATSADYLQIACDSTQKYVAFVLINTAEKDDPHPHKRSVTFEAKGLAVNLPALYFAPEWADLTRLILRLQGGGDDNGLMEFGLRAKDGREDLRRIGLVRVSCWNALLNFIKENRIDVKVEVQQPES
jgi:hypothetical protein